MSELDTRFIHYWVKEISDSTLEREISRAMNNVYRKDPAIAFKVFTILLDEKLRRAEAEISLEYR